MCSETCERIFLDRFVVASSLSTKLSIPRRMLQIVALSLSLSLVLALSLVFIASLVENFLLYKDGAVIMGVK